ncbi:MAG TPA: AEC family transporter [Candidatus Anaerostipes excrementavium]|uniref:AEC family transporter n=1 Tax=Candidatus Anaerostipes excrementavium TaxID=2838463 RepID=A0A9D1WX26_9FIRM|nr:AEC family transporter [uncultured Anaerostipes sp.]HIX68814.1 AEC family transporter [Candidatus Anaerostipes excrementavium]
MGNSVIIFEKLLVLFAFMILGSLSYKKKWITDQGASQISRLIVNLFNPALIITGITSSDGAYTWDIVLMNFLLSILLFAVWILLSPLIVRILDIKKDLRNMYSVMLIFSNLGFMGIPLVDALYGKTAIFLVGTYILAFNILFYTYGIYLFEKEKAQGAFHFQWKKLMNPGVFACLVSLSLFCMQLKLPDTAVTFLDYLGNAAVPLSMMMTGVSLAQMSLREVFSDWKMYQFTFVKMLVVPILVALVVRNFGLNPTIAGIFVLMFGMPNGSMPVMLAVDYGMDSSICSRGIVLTTLLSLITLPIVTYFI